MNEETILHIGQALVAYNPGWCKGFFVTKDFIATAGHCLKDRPFDNVEVHLRNGTVMYGSIAAVDFQKDIGLIRVHPSHAQQPVELSKSELGMGYQVAHAQLLTDRHDKGHPFNIEYGIFNKMVKPSLWANQWTTEMLAMELQSQKGCSGSPIIHDGKVHGVLVAGNDFGEVFAVPSKYIIDLIKGL